MGAVASVVVAVSGVISLICSSIPGDNPTHNNIGELNRLRREQAERERATQAARKKAERLEKEAEANAQQAREAEAAMEAAQAEAERLHRQAESVHVDAQQREQEIRERAREELDAAQREALRQQRRAEEQNRLAIEAQRAAEDAARLAANEAKAALEVNAELERQLREGIQPVLLPSTEEFEAAKRRIGYRDGLYHFAVAGTAGSGKSSLINALRGLRNNDAGAAETGVTETTLSVSRFPDPNPKSPIVWYDIPGAGTLKVPDWQYFNDQGLYVYDALIVLTDNRFTQTDIAILRNARLFHIPCYIVRSKADVHIRNVMLDAGYDSDDEDQDARSRKEMTDAAQMHYVSATEKSVKENLRTANLGEQRVYIVSNLTMLRVSRCVTKGYTPEVTRGIIHELELLRDVLEQAYQRRGVVKR